MFVADIARAAVSGQQRFHFTRLELTVAVGNSLRAIKGMGPVANADGCFEVRFTSQCKDSQTMAMLLQPGESDRFSTRLEGVEKNGAVWHAQVKPSNIAPSLAPDTCLIKVSEWERLVPRGGEQAFTRVLLPLYLDYPGRAVHGDAGLVRTARINIGGWHFELNNYGEYTEILLCNGSDARVMENALDVLEGLLLKPLHWVFREVHDQGTRRISVRVRKEIVASADPHLPAVAALPSEVFWQSFCDELAARLEDAGDDVVQQ